ncbi:unnamed protein product [Ambrosiozyma monospora]|uniref:Unnamed protein product n=1 Tax=Ambrosiozyma monospora TaxID=43982 RepID=A0ACB5TGA0_AMBMO|nr:unnamed protein product [Ambrosiozyma monospora]
MSSIFRNFKTKSAQAKPLFKYTFNRIFLIASWIPVLYVIHEHVFHIGKIEGISMKPTFNPTANIRDHVLLWKWNVKRPETLKQNDVVFLRSPINPELIYIKRIKGQQGDLITPRYPDTRSKVLIPTGHVWVEGDNVHSIDSNTYGPVSTGLVIGKVGYIVWPLNRIGPVPDGGRECRISMLRNQGLGYGGLGGELTDLGEFGDDHDDKN